MVEVVPISRPRTQGMASPYGPVVAGYGAMAHRSFATTSMKRLTRSPSTGFQVSPSTLKWVPITTPSAIERMSATFSHIDAGIGEHRHAP